MKRIFVLAIVFFLFKTFCFAQTPSQLFQQALLKENGEGDLKAAVGIYQRIVDDAAADRSLKAKALLHIGMCWEKLGKQDAIAAYQRVIEEYNDQQTIAQEARDRLRLIKDQSPQTETVKPIYNKIIESDNEIWGAHYSPNGKWIAIGNGDQIWLLNKNIMEIDTLARDIPHRKDELQWKPDGNFISFIGTNQANNSNNLWGLPINQENGLPQGNLSLLVDEINIYSYDWHPNRNEICYSLRSYPKSEIGIYSIDEKKKIWFSEKNMPVPNIDWSSDGTNLYYAMWDTMNNITTYSTYYIDGKTKKEQKFLPGGLIVDISPSGKFIACDLLGESDNTPILRLLSSSNKNSIDVKIRSNMSRLFEGSFARVEDGIILPVINFQSSINKINVLNGSKSQFKSGEAFYNAPVVSHDGKYLLYDEFHPDMNMLHIHHFESGTEKIFAVDNIFGYPHLSPNGKYVAYSGRPSYKAKWELKILNLETNSTTMIDKPSSFISARITWSPDSKWFAFATNNAKQNMLSISDPIGNKKEIDHSEISISSADWFSDNNRLIYAIRENDRSKVMVYFLAENKKQFLFESKLFVSSPTIAPNENTFAFLGSDSLYGKSKMYLAPVIGGDFQEISPDKPESIDEVFKWLPDKNRIVAKIWHSSRSSSLQIFDISRKQKEQLVKEDQGYILDFSVAPDGKTIYYDHYFTSGSTLWEIDISEAIEKLK